MFGGSAKPHPADEPIHKGLARGAFHKAAQKYKDGEIGDKEFQGHIKQAHSRLQDPISPMGMAMPMPMKTAKERTTKHKRVKKNV